jgi:hypothetical protein
MSSQTSSTAFLTGTALGFALAAISLFGAGLLGRILGDLRSEGFWWNVAFIVLFNLGLGAASSLAWRKKK